MNSYFNHTRAVAIVTLNVQSVNKADEALFLAEHGEEKVTVPLHVSPGYHDIVVDPGKELRIPEGTVASFISVRTG